MSDYNRRYLPPPAALAAFVAAARHESFSRAASEIGQTQSAVSRQIAGLEEWLRVPLFHRHGPRVRLTAAGLSYLEEVAPALRAIQQATRRIMRQGESRALNLATLPSFGMRWLAPRMADLTRHAPELIVNMSARTHEFDFADEMFDAAIHFGEANWPDAEHDRLFGEKVVAVVAPTLLRRHPIERAEDFAALPLLLQAERPKAWAQWFAQAGIAAPISATGPTFEHFTMLAQAAVGGGGAALIPRFMIEDELAAGTLISPVAMTLASRFAYYLVYPRAQLDRPDFRLFRSWLLGVART